MDTPPPLSSKSAYLFVVVKPRQNRGCIVSSSTFFRARGSSLDVWPCSFSSDNLSAASDCYPVSKRLNSLIRFLSFKHLTSVILVTKPFCNNKA